ncbi:MAG: ABC transporter permease [Acidimicrobiales bacterium]
MSWRRSGAIVRHELRILRNDPAFAIIFTLMPLVVMAFIKPAFRASLVVAGVHGANGAEQAVPGTAVMFSFFMVGNVGFAVFREHGWATWERLRASRARPLEIMAGKVVVPFLTLALQLTVLFGVGGLVFGLHVQGSVAGLVVVAAALALSLVALGLALLAICRTVNQLNAVANLGTMVFAGLGGAVAPISALPGWARAVAPVAPTYWAMRGFRAVILHPRGVGSVVLPAAVLLAFAAGFAMLAAMRFRFEEVKISWA